MVKRILATMVLACAAALAHGAPAPMGYDDARLKQLNDSGVTSTTPTIGDV